jgi:hypothetical protein
MSKEPGAPKSAIKTVGRMTVEEREAIDAANAEAVAAGAGAGAGEPGNRFEMLQEFMNNRETYSAYTEMLKEFGGKSRSVAAAIAAEGVAMDDAKMKKAQMQNQIMRDGMERVSAAGTDKEKADILREIEDALAALDAESLGGRRRRRRGRGRGRGSKTTRTKRLRRNHRNHRRHKNTRRHR